MTMQIVPRSASRSFGAIVSRLKLKPAGGVTASSAARLRAALRKHRVLVLRADYCCSAAAAAAAAARKSTLSHEAKGRSAALVGGNTAAHEGDGVPASAATLTEDELLSFFGCFDVPLPQDGREGSRGSRAEIFAVTNIVAEDVPPSQRPTSPFLTDAELEWHSDLSYRREPGVFSMLHALHLPDDDGERGSVTWFADTVAACAALPPSLRVRLEGLEAVHRHPEPHMNVDGEVLQPIIRVHPETEEAALFVSPMFTSHIKGIPEQESDGILEALFNLCAEPQFQFSHEWRRGDLVIWDNRSTMHRREKFDGPRLLWRAQSRGPL
eukprot:SAG25_NODE_386_length_8683_cov_36.568150_4_plen_325_part_00